MPGPPLPPEGPPEGPSPEPFNGRTGLLPDRALPYTGETARGTVSSRTALPEEADSGEAAEGSRPSPGGGTGPPAPPGGVPRPGTGWAGWPADRGCAGSGDRSARVRSSSCCQSPTSHLRHFWKPPTNQW
ncbi:hypothetical protein Pve01_54470 [Planomonospora venezuelensis]|nr:hypothetical protein Pve01_54470 [Planomonospora venezuelensis]